MHTWNWCTRLVLCVSIVMVVVLGNLPVRAENLPDSPLETTECGWLTEKIGFSLYRDAAGSALIRSRERRGHVMPQNASAVAIKTSDGRHLQGYKLAAASGQPAGYILFVQGNAMLADEMVSSLDFLASLNADIFVFDYRGYGQSNGLSRLKAIVHDYSEIIAQLNQLNYQRRVVYAVSFGGVVFANAMAGRFPVDGAVIHSSPASVESFGCPETRNPVAVLPQDASKITTIIGLQDTVVLPKDSRPLADLVKTRGGKNVELPELGHAFKCGSKAACLSHDAAVVAALKPYLE